MNEKLKIIGEKYKIFSIRYQFGDFLYISPKWDDPVIEVITIEKYKIVCIALCFHQSDINSTNNPNPLFFREMSEFRKLAQCLQEIEETFTIEGCSVKIEYCKPD